MTIAVECVVDAQARLGEGAVWDAGEAALYWTDIDAGIVHRFDPSSGADGELSLGVRAGPMALREAGGAVIGTDDGIHALDLATGAMARLADPEADRPHNRFNDGTTDRQGRWWIGSCAMTSPPTPTGAFYRMDPDGAVARWLDGVYTTNGLAFSPDGRTMYLSDSFPAVRTIWAADYDTDTGTPGARRLFFDTRTVAGRPDGATVDADGCYYMAGVGGWQVLRLTPSGALDLVIDMPVERPSRPAFGGPDLATLYVTSIATGVTPGTHQPLAGGLFAVTGLPTGGLRQARFAG